MRSRATPAASPTIILEVGPRVAKLISGTSSPLAVQRMSAVTLPEETSEATAALKSLLASGGLSARQVGILFARETFSVRTLELPSTNPAELSSMLDLQLGKLTPYPRAEILSSWANVGSFREGYTSVVLAIGRKTLIEEVLQFLKTKGVGPQWVGVSSEGLEAWWTLAAKRLPPPVAGQLTALIDVDATSTDCAILSSSGRLLFTYSIAIGASQLASGEQAKLRWAGELIRLPRILLHEDVKGQIGHGIVTGVTEGLREVFEQLGTQWGVPVEATDALSVCGTLPATVTQQVTASRVSSTALIGALALGAAPRIDLIPQEMRVSAALSVRAKHLTRLAASLTAALLLIVVLSLERTILLRHRLRQLQGRLASVEQTAAQVMQRKEAMQVVRAWLDPSRSALEALRVVSAASGQGMAITQFSFGEDASLKIRGTAEAVRAPYEFVDRLKQQTFGGAPMGCYVTNARSTGSRGAEFEIVCGKAS